MNKKQNLPSYRTSSILILTFYFAALATQILVISKIIPYQWVNGGMSTSYEAQATQSVISIILTSLLFIFVWKIKSLKTSPAIWQKRILYAITAFWMLGFILQIVGTPFERYVMSIVLLVGVFGHVRLIRELPKLRRV